MCLSGGSTIFRRLTGGWRRLWGVVLGCGVVWCVPLAPAQPLPDITFSVRPRLCVLAQGETLCKDEIEVRWQSPLARSLCLYSAEQTEPLDCWQDTTWGEYRTILETGSDIEFSLKEMADSEVLARQAFEVVQDDRRYRRKRRNPWSFF